MSKTKQHILIVDDELEIRKIIQEILNDEGYSVTVIAPWDEYSPRLSELGAKYEFIEMETNGLNPLKDLIYMWNLVKIYKKVNPFANLLFTVKPNIYGTLVSRFFGIITICNITGLGSNFLNKGIVQSLIKVLYKVAFQFSTKVFFQNGEDKDLFLNQKLVKEKQTQLIPGSGVDLNHYKPEAKEDNDFFTFLMIGRVIKDKGVLEYVEAAKLMLKKYDSVKFCLLGECDSDSLSSISFETISRWQTSGLIEYLGEVEDVRNYISSSDVVVLPSSTISILGTILIKIKSKSVAITVNLELLASNKTLDNIGNVLLFSITPWQ